MPKDPSERTDIAVTLRDGRVVRVEATHPENIGRVFVLDDDRALALELQREKGPRGRDRFTPLDE